MYAKNLGGYTLETRRRAASADRAKIEAPRGVGFLGMDVLKCFATLLLKNYLNY